MIAAKDEVRMTRFTVGANALMALRIPVVPLTAGSMKSLIGSSTLKWKGEAV
jgi:hypothetical protein